MPIIEEIIHEIATQQERLTKIEQDVSRHEAEYDEAVRKLNELLSKLTYPGSTFITNLVFGKPAVYEGSLTIPAGGPHTLPATAIDINKDRQHAFYLISAFNETIANQDVFYGGALTSYFTNTVTVGYVRRYKSAAPGTLETYLMWHNLTAGDVPVRVKVVKVLIL